jgi:DNA polymerase-3 subunit delta'
MHVITKELIRYHDKSGTSKGTTLSVQVIRPELIEPAWRTPTIGRAKVFIVEQADLMQAQAQNAILKTLEEPAGRTLIVLLTDQAESLLPTVRSRCQVVTFLPLPDDVAIAQLQRRGIDKPLAVEAAGLARGSLGLAIQWIADGVVETARQIIEQLQLIERGRPCQFGALVKEAADAYAQKQLERDELASKEQATRQGLLLYLDMAAEHYRRQLCGGADPQRNCAAIESIARAREYLDANVNVAVALQQLELALCRAA